LGTAGRRRARLLLRGYLKTSHEPRCVENGMDARKADDADPPRVGEEA
jgi:hypothetical protein